MKSTVHRWEWSATNEHQMEVKQMSEKGQIDIKRRPDKGRMEVRRTLDEKAGR